YSSDFDIGFKATYNQANLAVAKRMVEIVSCESVDEELLKKLTLPSGRFESIKFNEHVVIIDYAHTPDALENICKTIKKDFPDFCLVAVFGCGGDRDKSKRPLMGSAVAKFADSIIVTSDNPRTENAETIIKDILPGIDVPFQKEVDRRKAIRLSLSTLKSKSVILIAGKGHEEYQDIMGKKNHFSDKEEVINFIRETENV
ncbi:glutamate ligase domain-containing protein, partial [Halobacteriovorax sp.]|uniref:glutamate ligase domain-containing protein n=1 Tax=Halobacteriovorax sp. TaxID=2020862 RepID=UPI0035623290